jgi:hypothetical protein
VGERIVKMMVSFGSQNMNLMNMIKANEFSVFAGAIRAAVATGNNTDLPFVALDGLEVPAV